MTSLSLATSLTSLQSLPALISPLDEENISKILEIKSLKDLYKNSPLASVLLTTMRKFCYEEIRQKKPSQMHLGYEQALNNEEINFGKFVIKLVSTNPLTKEMLEAQVTINHQARIWIECIPPKGIEVLAHFNHLLIREIVTFRGSVDYISVDNPEDTSTYLFTYKQNEKWGFFEVLLKGKNEIFRPESDLGLDSLTAFFIDKNQEPLYRIGCGLEMVTNVYDPETMETLKKIQTHALYGNVRSGGRYITDFKATCIWKEFDKQHPIPNSITVEGVFNIVDDSINFFPPSSTSQKSNSIINTYYRLSEQFKPYIHNALKNTKDQFLKEIKSDQTSNKFRSYTQIFPSEHKMSHDYAKAILELLEEAKLNHDEALIFYLEAQESSSLTNEELLVAQAKIDAQRKGDLPLIEELANEKVPSSISTIQDLNINHTDHFSPNVIAQALIYRIENQKAIQPSEDELKIKAELKAKRKKKHLQEQKFQESSSSSISDMISTNDTVNDRSYIEFKKAGIRALARSISAEDFLSETKKKTLAELRNGVPVSKREYYEFKRALIQARATALGVTYREDGEGSHLVGHADRGFTLFVLHGGDRIPNANQQLKEVREILFFNKPQSD